MTNYQPQPQPQPPVYYPNSLVKNNSDFKFGIIAFCLSISIVLFFIVSTVSAAITNLSEYSYLDNLHIQGFFLVFANLNIIPSIVFAIIGLTKVNKLKNKKGLMIFFCISGLIIPILFIFYELCILLFVAIVAKSITNFFDWLSNNSDKLAAMG